MLLACGIILFNNYLFQKKIENLFQAGEDISINVRIDSLLNQITYGYEYVVKIYSIDDNDIFLLFQPTVKLIADSNTQFLLGERWNLNVSIKPVNGRLNEAGFDQEKYFLSQNIQGKAVVKYSNENKKLSESTSFRLWLYQQVDFHTASLTQQPILLALSFGDRSKISAEQWGLLKSSGLIHLVAISGLHIGMAFLLGWYIGISVRWLIASWYWSPLVCGLFLALSYAWLAGFSLTTMRALMMCLMMALLHILRINFSHWFKLLIILCCLILVDPFSLLSTSLWLSFSAVIGIYLILSMPYIQHETGIKKLFKSQLVLTLIMLPSSIYFFNGLSVLSPLFNLVFIPWFTFFQVPLLFITIIITVIAPSVVIYLWQFNSATLSFVMWATTWTKESWLAYSSSAGLGVFLMLMIILLRGVLSSNVNNLLIVTGLSVLLFSQPIKPVIKENDRWGVSILDVGHGLAILINRQNRTILYDTGNRWVNGSIAESIIIPVMLARGVTELDSLILSHLDSDHAGGKEIIEQKLLPKSKFSSQHMLGYQPCIKDNNWVWQGLTFNVLWPPKTVNRAFNPHSCVINISDGNFSILLTGDVDAISEFLLVKDKEKLQADVVIVPHHGSDTSSRSVFIHSISPSLAIASVAKDNQWNLPSEKVKERYANADVKWLDTGHSGQINIIFDREEWRFFELRTSQSLSWYRQMLRKGVE